VSQSCACFSLRAAALNQVLQLTILTAEIAHTTLTTQLPSYTTIKELHRRIVESPLPYGTGDAYKPMYDPQFAEVDLNTSMFLYSLSCMREVCTSISVFALLRARMLRRSSPVFLYIHRAFFAQAVTRHPHDPTQSPYADSFHAAYAAARTIVSAVRAQFERHPRYCVYFWHMWTYALSAAVSKP
jgi:hypothetical protein